MYNLQLLIGHLATQVAFHDLMSRFSLCCSSDLCSDISFSFSGLGRTAPDPGAAVTLDGVQVPLGKGVHTNIDDTSLLYNEYPLIFISWFMIWIIILPNGPTFFHVIHSLIVVCRGVQSQKLSEWILFSQLN